MQKTVRFNSCEVSAPAVKNIGGKAITPLMEQIDEERSGKSDEGGGRDHQGACTPAQT